MTPGLTNIVTYLEVDSSTNQKEGRKSAIKQKGENPLSAEKSVFK